MNLKDNNSGGKWIIASPSGIKLLSKSNQKNMTIKDIDGPGP